MLNFQTETWANMIPEARELFPEHWKQLAIDKGIELSVNYEEYDRIEKVGCLNVVTARHFGDLVGYHTALVDRHLHYKDAGNMAYTDMYWMRPEYRRGMNGIAFLDAVASSLRERKVVKAYMSCKVHQDHSTILKYLGWKPTDLVFAKLL